MAKRPIHELTVEGKRQLTPNMLRVTLVGKALHDFPPDAVGGYVKLLIPPAQSAADDDTGDGPDLGAFTKRSYTIRSVDVAAGKLVLDFVVHADGGPATAWVQAAQPGDAIQVAGPGPVKMLNPSADAVFLAGDMTGLPAMAVNLELLPRDMRGAAVIAIHCEQDRQDLDGPPGVKLHWLVSPDARSSGLADAVRALPWPGGRVSVWSASEFASMRALRSYFRDQRKVHNDDLYISSYWKLNATDEQHKLAKHADNI